MDHWRNTGTKMTQNTLKPKKIQVDKLIKK